MNIIKKDIGIPKIIHQIWFQGQEFIPEHLISYQNSWKEKNPNYQYMFWDENSIKDLIKKINVDWIKGTYDFFPLMIQKIDFAKYIILYYIGGIYIDMDMKCLNPLDSLLELQFVKDKKVILSNLTYDFVQRIVFLLTGNFNIKNLVNNGVIMCEPRHEIMLNTIKYGYQNKNNFFKNKSNFLYIFYSTGPLALSNALIDYTNKSKNKLNEIELLDQDYFEGCDIGEIKNNNCKIPEKAIGMHYYEGSWNSENEKISVKVYYFIKDNIILLIILLLIAMYMMKKK
jgi:mannosyltransferase OCH1-like enzyme